MVAGFCSRCECLAVSWKNFATLARVAPSTHHTHRQVTIHIVYDHGFVLFMMLHCRSSLKGVARMANDLLAHHGQGIPKVWSSIWVLYFSMVFQQTWPGEAGVPGHWEGSNPSDQRPTHLLLELPPGRSTDSLLLKHWVHSWTAILAWTGFNLILPSINLNICLKVVFV